MHDWMLPLEEDLWRVTLRQFPIWALIRSRVYMYMDEKQLDYHALPSAGNRVHLQTRRWGRYLRTLGWMAFSRQGWDTAFLVRSNNRYPIDDAHSFDRLHQPFYERIPRPVIFESTLQADWPLPDQQVARSVLSQDLLWLLANRLAKLQRGSALTADETQAVEAFITQVIDRFNIPELQDELSQTVMTLLTRLRMVQAFTRRFIVPRLRTPVVFMEDAAYLAHRAILTQAFHAHGVKVIEIQHGFVSHVHYPYNYPPEVMADTKHPARDVLPDVYVTYGEYWSNIIRLPSEKVVVGSPYLTKLAQENTATTTQNDRQVLVISSYIVTDRTIALVKALAEDFPDHTVIVKLHPQEIPYQARFEAALPHENVRIVGFANVYPLIAESKIIVSLYASTILAEAVAFPDKRLFCAEVGTYPQEMTTAFSSPDELIQLIRTPNMGYPTIEPSQFWASDWQVRLDAFLKQTFDIHHAV